MQNLSQLRVQIFPKTFVANLPIFQEIFDGQIGTTIGANVGNILPIGN